MARCQISGTSFDWNPVVDSGWMKEPVREIQHVPGSSLDIIQTTGLHSSRRNLEGTTQSSTVKAALDAAIGTSTTFKDRDGTTFNVWVDALQTDEVNDITNLTNKTFHWKLSLIRLA